MGALLLKQLLEKDHISLFSDILENPPENITGILQHTVEHFGETHTKQDIKDLNSLLGWVSYAYAPLTLAELNAVIGIESDQGEFLDMRDKLEREFSSYFSIIDLNRRMHPPQIEDIPEDSTIGQATSQGSPQDVRREAPEEIQGEVQEDKFNQELDVGFVRFAHASIAKFFRAGKPTPVGESHKHLLIGMEKTDAHLQIARTCLRVICSTKTSSTSRDSGVTDNLLNYAANNFHKHLKEAQWAIVYEENIDIARYIIQMFRDEAVMDGWVREGEFSKLWFDPETFETSDTCGNGTLDIITTWLTGEIIQKGLNADERTWINVPSRTAGEKFLTPVALWFAKKWLQDPNSDLNYQAIYLFAMLNGLLKFVSSLTLIIHALY